MFFSVLGKKLFVFVIATVLGGLSLVVHLECFRVISYSPGKIVLPGEVDGSHRMKFIFSHVRTQEYKRERK